MYTHHKIYFSRKMDRYCFFLEDSSTLLQRYGCKKTERHIVTLELYCSIWLNLTKTFDIKHWICDVQLAKATAVTSILIFQWGVEFKSASHIHYQNPEIVKKWVFDQVGYQVINMIAISVIRRDGTSVYLHFCNMKWKWLFDYWQYATIPHISLLKWFNMK